MLLTAKLLFQAVTRLKYNWDDIITNEDIINNWSNWVKETAGCNNISIHRSILPSKDCVQENLRGELVGFCDGSSVGYGCALYIRWKDRDESYIETKFLCAKSKVAPIKGNTVPRNELNGALLLARLTWSTLESLKKTELCSLIVHSDITLNSDSTTVLSWIKSPAFKFKPFVKNKVVEIQSLLPSCIWKFIPSKCNTAADLLSKGCKSKELNEILTGPKILGEQSGDNLIQPDVNTEEVDEEKLIEVRTAPLNVDLPLLDLTKYNSWKKLIRVTAYIVRFVRKLRQGKDKTINVPLCDSYYTPDPIDTVNAKSYWLKYAQRDLTSNLDELNPYEDEFGIQRVTGRIQKSEIFDHDRKHPIILCGENPVSTLILNDIHNDLFHPGPNRVIAESRKKFWIVKVRKIAKKIGNKCTICRRWRNKHLSQIMSDLPWFRIDPGGPPFQNMSADYFGPFLIKFGKRQRTKAYGAIFTCLTTRAIHLELATSLTTDSFLLAFRRFISLYGQPKFVRSDNGNNFRGAAREIAEMIKYWRNNEQENGKLRDFAAKYEFKWTFSTPLASHHNGAVESMIKSVKQALRKVINERVLTEEKYRTVLAQIQAVINSRPLWPSNEGDLQEPPITPNDLLRPKGLNKDPSQLNQGSNPRLRYDFIQRLVDEWWRQWMMYFVPNLQTRSKWKKQRENLEQGDIVLLIDPDVSRGKWKMGIVQEVYPGGDGDVRSAKIRTQSGTYDRPITKLCLLLSKAEYDSEK